MLGYRILFAWPRRADWLDARAAGGMLRLRRAVTPRLGAINTARTEHPWSHA
jgi:hypothetical protein